MSEQASLFGPTLPVEFVVEWRRLEREADRSPVVLAAEQVQQKPMGWWIVVRVAGRRLMVANRRDLTQAARDLFTQYGGGQ